MDDRGAGEGRSMRKGIALVLSGVLVCAALTGCADKKASGEKETIKIGAAMCLTGIQAPLDAPALEGAQLAVDELNAKGGILGKKVSIQNIDGKSDAVTVGDAAKQLISDGAVAMMTPSDFDFGGPAAREAQNNGLVGISPCASSPLFGSKALGDKQFTLSMWNTTMGATMADKAIDEGYKSCYIVTDTFIDYTKSLSKYFGESFTDQGGKVLREDKFEQGKLDPAVFLARYKSFAEKPDFIYVSSYMPDLGTLIRAFREAGIDVPIYGGDAYDDPALAQALGKDYANNIMFATHSFLSDKAVAGYSDFAAAYKKKFNKDLDAPWAMAGYDAIMVLAQSMEKAGSTEGAAVAKAMEEGTFTCLTGKLDWSDAAGGHEPNKAACIVELKDATPTFVTWATPRKIPAP